MIRDCKFKAFVVCLLLLTPGPAPGQSFSPLTMSFQDALFSIRTPQDMIHLMKEEFRFEEDWSLFGTEDYWQDPEEFWRLKSGDCEDYALFSQYILQRLGYESYVVSLYGEFGYAHTVNVFLTDTGYNVINEDRLYEYGAPTLEEALSRVNSGWIWGAIAERRQTRGWMVQSLLNTEPW